jgi:anaerobic selenocysteine-containing dehydrogenase
VLFRRLGAARLARTVCAAPTGAANGALYGKMASVVYQDYPEARLILLWGVNPSASGIHLMPYLKEARQRGATIVVVDPRATPVARQADLHLAVRPGTDVVVALALHRHLFESGAADTAFLTAHTTGAAQLRERALPWTFERAADVSGVRAEDIEQLARLYATSTPALVKCGWGLERNRNGGNAALAVLALPAVGGKFGVRGGGYSMSNSASWGIDRTWLHDAEPQTRVVNMNRVGRELLEPSGPPIRGLFVYNCNPAVTLPDQQRVLAGLSRDDLFTVVFDQVLTDTAAYADVVLPATTFLEHYDFAKSYGALSLQLARPVIEPVAESRPNADVFHDPACRPTPTRPTSWSRCWECSAECPRRLAARSGNTAWRVHHSVADRCSSSMCFRRPPTARSRSIRRPSPPMRRSGSTRSCPTRAPPSIRWRSSHRRPNAR